MFIEVIAPGRIKEGYIQAGADDYLKRLRRYNRAEVLEVKVKARASAVDEGNQLLARVGAPLLVALDPAGRGMSSEGLASRIQGWMNGGVKGVSFLIGGPTGHSPAVRQRADLLLSLSPMTFTHDMARLLLLEQLYRAFAIINGSQYHK
ncbi:MAG: 23S rRNA (pseudouridine(1915)-N(3))-methyltransferase RlmH [Thermodesulfobacteriota bacterium]